VRLRKLVLVPVAAALGAGVVVLPALAASEPPTIEAITGCNRFYPSYPCWKPETVTIASGGTVKIVNPSSTLEQGIVWEGASMPACEKAPTRNQKGPWEETCTFTAPGTYRFNGTQIYSEAGKVVVTGSSSTTPTATTTESTPTSTTGTSTAPGGSTTPTTSSPSGSPSPLASLFVGSATTALKLPTTQHGHSVHGSVNVSQAGVGGSLEVQLLATRASLAGAGHFAHVQVGKVVRGSLHAGVATFTVSLDAAARRALRERGHLELSVKLVLSSAQGTSETVTRSVLVRS
jgi:plastocyanin